MNTSPPTPEQIAPLTAEELSTIKMHKSGQAALNRICELAVPGNSLDAIAAATDLAQLCCTEIQGKLAEANATIAALTADINAAGESAVSLANQITVIKAERDKAQAQCAELQGPVAEFLKFVNAVAEQQTLSAEAMCVARVRAKELRADLPAAARAHIDRVDKLEAALKPFAMERDKYPPPASFRPPDRPLHSGNLKLSDLDRAKEALAFPGEATTDG